MASVGGRGLGGDGMCQSAAPPTRSQSRGAAPVRMGALVLVLCAPCILHRRCGSRGVRAGAIGGAERRAAAAVHRGRGGQAGSRRRCGRAAARASRGAEHEGPPRPR